MKKLVMIFLLLTSCTNADPDISLLRALNLPSTKVVADRYYTNNTSSSPTFHLDKYSEKYDSRLDRFEYRLSTDSEWTSLGKNYDFSIPFAYAQDGSYYAFVRAVTIDNLITDIATLSWYVDTIPVAIDLQIGPVTDITKSPQIHLNCINCDELTLVKADLYLNNTGVFQKTITAKAGEVIQFDNLSPTSYVIIFVFTDRAGNTRDTYFGFSACDNVTTTCL